MAKVHLYYHGGSKNHGCEAIVRATLKLFDNQKLEVYSMYPDEDILYGLEKICNLKYDKEQHIKKKSIKYFLSAIDQKILHSTKKYTYYRWQDFFDSIVPGDIYLATGGDNYCYDGTYKLADYNKIIHEKGGKTVLWGCSIEPSRLTKSVIEDLKLYDLITVRETLSMKALNDVNIVDNVILCSDPAFQLDSINKVINDNLQKEIIGINISPLVVEYGKNKDIVLNSYIKLINYIINNTEYIVMLIPHVIKEETDDRKPEKKLYDIFSNIDRVYLMEDHNCMELKGYISRCRFFIGARTHATIAAYSTCVPTLVIGYSIKAKGIARDIFGTYENYVIPVQLLENEYQLVEAFKWLCDNEENIKEHLDQIMPDYTAKALIAKEKVEELFHERRN